MSHTFYVNGAGKVSLAPTLTGTGLADIVFTDDSPKPAGGEWPRGTSYAYLDKRSVRPVEVEYDGKDFSARIFAASCPDDYTLGLKLVETVARASGALIEPEDGEAQNADVLARNYGRDWIKEHCLTTLRMVIGNYLKDKDGVMQLMGTRAELKAGKRFLEPMLADTSNFARTFFDRFRRLNYIDQEDVFMASLIVLSDKDSGREARIAVYSEAVPTVLAAKADAIVLRPDTLMRPEAEDEPQLMIAVDTLAALMDGQGYWLSEHLYFAPGLDQAGFTALMDRARSHAITDLFAVAKPVEAEETTTTSPFSSDQWRDLLRAPLLVFAVVAGADGTIDKKEIRKFQEQLLAAATGHQGLMRELITALLADMEAQTRAVLGGEVEPVEALKRVAAALDGRLPADEAQAVKIELLRMGKGIAEASGGFFGFGSKISKAEKQALAALVILLNLEIPGSGH